MRKTIEELLEISESFFHSIKSDYLSYLNCFSFSN